LAAFSFSVSFPQVAACMCSWCFFLFSNAFSYWQKLSFTTMPAVTAVSAQVPRPSSVRHSCTYAHCQLVRPSPVDRHCHNSCHAARPLFSSFSPITIQPPVPTILSISQPLCALSLQRPRLHAIPRHTIQSRPVPYHPIPSHPYSLPMALPALAERKHFLITQMLSCPARFTRRAP